MRRMMVAAALAALVGAAPALAQGKASFSVGDKDFTVPLPAGYCVPTLPADVQRVNAIAAYDDENLTSLSLIACGPRVDPIENMVVKTPRAAVSQPVKLSDILESPEFKGEYSAEVNDQNMAGLVKRETGRDASVASDIRILGHDTVCGYVGGTVSVQMEQTRIVSVAGCMTVVGERMLLVLYTAPGDDPALIRRLAARARAFAVTIRVLR